RAAGRIQTSGRGRKVGRNDQRVSRGASRLGWRVTPMSNALISPRLLKGALIGVDIFNPIASFVVFQYNPDTMTRRLEPRGPSADGERGEAFRLSGPPKETITLAIEIDATDLLADV